MRIAAFASGSAGSSPYRAFKPMLALARRGHVVWANSEDAGLPPDLAAYDVGYIQRYQDRPAQRLVRQLRDAGLAVVWDHDDAVDRAASKKAGALAAQSASSEITAMVRLADVVTTTNERLAAQYRGMGARSVHVVENYLNEEFLAARPRGHDGLVLGWAAWSDHQADWRSLGLQRTVGRLLDAHPELHVVSVGPIDLGLPADRYTRTPPVAFDDIAAHMADFDIAIAPIVDTPFNRARSNIKLKEYAALSIPWLASAIGPYAGMGEREGGRLVADDRWPEELERLIVDGRLRRKLAKRGRRWASRHLLRDNAGAWEAALSEAVEHARAESTALAR